MKQVIVVRTDIGMSVGKTVAQACHACLGAYVKSSLAVRKKWEIEGAKKVALECDSLEQVRTLEAKARSLKIPHYTVADAGLTELAPGTVTAIGIGPAKDEEIDKVTGSLRLLK